MPPPLPTPLGNPFIKNTFKAIYSSFKTAKINYTKNIS